MGLRVQLGLKEKRRREGDSGKISLCGCRKPKEEVRAGSVMTLSFLLLHALGVTPNTQNRGCKFLICKELLSA